MSGPRRDIEEQPRHSESSAAPPPAAGVPTRSRVRKGSQDGVKTKPPQQDVEELDIDIDVMEEADLARTRELQRAFLHSSSDEVRRAGPPRRGGSGGARYRAMAPPPPTHRRVSSVAPRAFDEPPVPGAPLEPVESEGVDVAAHLVGAGVAFQGKELDPEEVPSVAEFMGDRWGEFGIADNGSADGGSAYSSVTATWELPALSVSAELDQASMGEPVDDLGVLGFQDPSLGGSLGGSEPLSFDVEPGATLPPSVRAAVRPELLGSGDAFGVDGAVGMSDDDDPFMLGDDDDILFGAGPTSALTPASIKRPVSDNDLTMPGFDVARSPLLTPQGVAPSVHLKSTDELKSPSRPGSASASGAPPVVLATGGAGAASVHVRPSVGEVDEGQHRPPLSRKTAGGRQGAALPYQGRAPANMRTSRQMHGPQPMASAAEQGLSKAVPERPRKSPTPTAPPMPSPNMMAKTAAAMKMVMPRAERAPLPRRGPAAKEVVKAPEASAPPAAQESPSVEPGPAGEVFDVSALPDDVSALLTHAQRLRRAKDYADAHIVLKKLLKLDPEHYEAKQMFGLNEGALETRYLNDIGDLQALPVMAMSPGELMRMEIDSRGGYLLSMVDGHSSFQDLLELSPMEYLDTLRILAEFIAEGVLMVPSMSGPLSRRLRRDRGR